jgi:hypothetical protein
VKKYTAVFCVVKLVHSRLVYGYQHCRRTYCPHLQVRSNFYINITVVMEHMFDFVSIINGIYTEEGGDEFLQKLISW